MVDSGLWEDGHRPTPPFEASLTLTFGLWPKPDCVKRGRLATSDLISCAFPGFLTALCPAHFFKAGYFSFQREEGKAESAQVTERRF